ncbi:MAG: MMPL family transporter [Ilumatobacteraceae bacterium]|nr:MMPL family transporter [Ilumatobacteraceae bacterium]
MARLGRWCFEHRWHTLAAWLVALIGVGVLANGVIGSSFSAEFEIPASESASGFDVLDERFAELQAGGQSGSIVFRAEQGVDDPEVTAAMTALFEEIGEIEGVSVESPYAPTALGQINADRTVAFATVNLDRGLDQMEMAEVGEAIEEASPSIDGLTIEVGGQSLAEFEPPESELIGLAFAIVILILAFGSVLAMGLPIGVALFGVGLGASVVALLSNLTTIPDFATTLGAMIGLGVGIDYALFIVTRYREGLHHGMSPRDATVVAMDTAGRAVVFAGITVVVSLLGMLLIGLSFISGLGIGAATTVAVTMLASITLLPALLGFAQHRVEVTRWRGIIAAGLVSVALLGAGLGISALLVAAPLAVVVLLAGFAIRPLKKELPPRKVKPIRETLAYRWSRQIQARPWTWLIGGSLVLMLLAAPVLSLRLGFSDEGNFPEDTTTRRAYDLVAEGFGPGFNGPLLVVSTLESPDDVATVQELSAAIGATEGVALASPAFPDDPAAPTAAIIRVIPTTAPQDAATVELVDRLRTDTVPSVVDGTGVEAFVSGSTAASIDFTDYLQGRIVLFIGVVLALSFILLMLVFRSVLVPLKAVFMNLISIAAAYGVVVAIFQWGWMNGIFGVEPAPIEPFVPMMMFAIVFGLSMDYEVFLLSRVKEEWERTGDPVNSVADGLAATARVITAAAAIMIVVFGSFLLEEDRVIKLFGLGLAVAVFLDASLVRMLLVPATMELLGARNWWLPKWLDRILPKIDVEGHHAELDEPLPTDDDRDDRDREPALTGG